MPTFDKFFRRFGGQLTGLVLVLGLHGMVVYGLWQARLMPSPAEATTLFVNFIALPDVKNADEPKHPPEPKPKPTPKQPPFTPPQPLLIETPETAPAERVVPLPMPLATPAPWQATVAVLPIIQVPLPVGPVALSSELSVACPQRTAPSYPAISNRLGEAGRVVLRVELSETGEVASAEVQSSSGFVRLDEAALAAVRTWHCTPPSRNGQPVRATALQPFNFVIQGN